MGVLACDRYSCENIMCDVLVDEVGYICNECCEEFKIYLASNGINLQNENDMIAELKIFMKSYARSYEQDPNHLFDIDNFFKEHRRP